MAQLVLVVTDPDGSTYFASGPVESEQSAASLHCIMLGNLSPWEAEAAKGYPVTFRALLA